MPGRARNVDRQAIEAFARIHEGRAGSANGHRLLGGHHPGANGPDVQGMAHPLDATSDGLDPTGFGHLPPLPNLERPRIGRRVGIASIATVVVVLVALGITGATSGTGDSHKSASSAGITRAASSANPGSGSGSAAGPARRRSGAGRAGAGSGGSTATTAPTGPIAPASTAAGSVQFRLPPGTTPFSLTIAAAGGSCWAEAAASSGSSVSWEGTVAAGAQQVLGPGSSLWLRLGAPEYVTLTVNGRTLQLPATSAPLDVDISSS